MRVSCHERTGAKGRQHAAVIVNPSGEICPRADCRPHLDIAAREREHAGCARGAAGLIDPLDLFMRDAEITAERRRLVDRPLELLLRAERKPGNLPQRQARFVDARVAKSARVERRVVHDVAELLLPGRRRARERGVAWLGLHLAVPDRVAIAGVLCKTARLGQASAGPSGIWALSTQVRRWASAIAAAPRTGPRESLRLSLVRSRTRFSTAATAWSGSPRPSVT